MKQSTRRLLSLLMAFAIVLSLLPGSALAAVDLTEVKGSISGTKEITAGESTQLTPKLVDKNGQNVSINSVEWSLPNTSVAHWTDKNGQSVATITSGDAGRELTANSNITAATSVIVTAQIHYNVGTEDKSAEASATVTIKPAKVAATGITLDKPAMELTVGQKGTLTATRRPADTTDPITWDSDKKTVATVDNNGQVTAVAPGTAKITATCGKFSADCNVTVKAATIPATKISMDSKNPETVKVGQSGIVFKAILEPANTTDKVTWTSSNEGVATINPSTGAVVAKKIGKTLITATISDTLVAYQELNVAAADPIATISPKNPTVEKDKTRNLTANLTGAQYDSIKWTTTNGTGSVAISENSQDPKTATIFGTNVGKATVKVTFYKDNAVVAYDEVEVEVVAVSVGTLPLTPSSVSVAYGQVYSRAVTPTITSWPTAYYIDWSVSSGTGSIQISTTSSTSSSYWGTTAQTKRSTNSSTIPGVYVYGKNTGTATLYASLKDSSGKELARNSIPVTVTASGLTLSPNPSNTSAVYINGYWDGSSSGYSRTFSVTPYIGTTPITSNDYTINYVWKLNGYTVQSYTTSTTGANRNSANYTLYSNNQYLNSYYWDSNRSNTLTCTAYVTTGKNAIATENQHEYTSSVSWTVYTGYSNDLTVSATIYDSNPGYALTDTPDGSSTSIADQIDSWVKKNYSYYNYRDYDVRVSGGTHYESGSSYNRGTLTTNSNWLSYSDLSRIVFTPGSTVSSSTGSYQISFDFEVRLYTSSQYYDTAYGTMVFTVKQGTVSGGDITYSAGLGEDVVFSVSDFENFWSDLYSRGELSYVTFGSVSGGNVYNASNKSVGSSSYYVSPSRSQNGLDGVYFSPNSTTSKKATTIRIPFTASGTTSSSSKTTTSRTGSIVITYLSAAADKISYSTNTNGEVSLRAQDFIDAYKDAVNTSRTPTNLTIVFQGVPSYGTLTYTDSSKSSSRAVKLTNSNIKTRSFTTKTTGTNQLEDVVYTASGSRTETISYIGYIGSTATFTGEVVFNAVTAPTNVPVAFICYTTAGIPMSYSSFSLASPTAMANASYISFGTPRTGKLVNANGGNAANIPVLTTQLSNVTYVPATATAVTSDSFAFTAYNANNVVVASGTVTVTVSLPVVPTNPNAITSIDQFTDIPAPGPKSNWYRDQLTALIKKGVINGKGNGKFGPEDALAYGEALKMIMNAAGYYEAEANENLAGVSHWAQNYKNTAVQKGWLKSNVDLRATISRDAMAELTAKVLGIAASTDTTSPFADSTNPYAIALYKNKIVQGELWDNGTRHFTPNKALTRNEMVCLVYNMYVFTGK